MSPQSLQERLSQLQEAAAQLRALIGRLANLKLQPGSVALDESFSTENDGGSNFEDGCGGGGVVAELGADIRQGLRESQEDLALLREEVLDLREGRPGSEAELAKNRLKDGVERLGEELKGCRISFRTAQLSARKNLSAAQRAERRALLASYVTTAASSTLTSVNRSGASSPAPQDHQEEESEQQQQQQQQHPRRRRHPHHPAQQQRTTASRSPADPVVASASDVTSSLRRTHDLMAAELARSAYAAQALAESTAALRSLDERYSSLDSLLSASRDLLGTLLSSRKSDTWYLQTALYLLTATACWLVFRRLLYGPLWWLVWLPLRLVWLGGRGGLGLLAPGGGAADDGLGGSARMEVAGAGGRQTVVGIAREGGIPTASVVAGDGGGEGGKRGEKGEKGKRNRNGKEDEEGGEKDSMVERVGRIVDGQGDPIVVAGEDQPGSDAIPDEGEVLADHDGEMPNPKKRMWEEPEVEEKYAKEREGKGRVKDEL